MYATRPRPTIHLVLTALVVLGLTLMNQWQPARAAVRQQLPARTDAPAGLTDRPVEGPNASGEPVQGEQVAAGEVPGGLTSSAWQRMLAQIEQERYRFEQKEASTATGPVYRAANRAQAWRVSLSGAGVEVVPQGCGEGCEDETWQWRLAATGYGYGDRLQPIPALPEVSLDEKNELHYRWDDNLSEWYVNDARGLKQNFRLDYPPARTMLVPSLPEHGGTLVVEMALFGGLTPSVTADGQALLFRNAQGAGVLRYDALHVFDAGGRTLPAHLEMARQESASGRPYRVRIVVDDAGAVYPVTIDPLLYSEVTKLTASDAQAGDEFGASVALSGDTALVGANSEDGDAGAAYVFERNAGGADNWGQVKKLTASDAQADDQFGRSVALSGDTALVGADSEDGGAGDPLGDAGAAYVFERNAGGADNWGQVKKLTASDAQAVDLFGTSVALSGDTALVGAWLENGGVGDPLSQAGAAYVFERNAGGVDNWGEVKKLTASDVQADDRFGESVALSGDTALVGANREDGGAGDPLGDAGAAYVFERNAGGADNWGQVKKLTASDAQVEDYFGSVALSGDTALVGADSEDGGAGDPLSQAGAAYVFERNAGGADNWGQVKKLTASDAQAADLFGTSVALSGDTALVGALEEDGGPGDPLGDAGAAYVFERNAGGADNWGEVKKLTASDAQEGDFLGLSVALSGDTTLVGALQEDGGPGDPLEQAGAAYIYRLTLVAADLAVAKIVTPTLAAPGQSITYTLTFSNSGPGLASNVVISDAASLSLTVTGVASQTVGAGVTITQTGNAPNLVWAVSDLEVGEGGVITLTALVDDSLELLGSILTNTVTIIGTDDLTTTNNTANAALTIILPVTLTVTKTVGTNANSCATSDVLAVQKNTPVFFCFTLQNTGAVTFTRHTFTDPLLGINTTITNVVLGPGETVQITRSQISALGPYTVTASVTNTVFVTSTNVTATSPGPIVQSVDQFSATASDSATATITESPTALPVTDQPIGDNRLYLPALH